MLKELVVAVDLTGKEEDNIKQYYGEITLGVLVKSEKSLEELKNWLAEHNITADLNLNLLDGSVQKTDVIEVYETEWEIDLP